MPVFVCRLLPPRPSFAQDMNAEEAAAMGEHMAYWQRLLAAGRVIAYGPVADPAGLYGLGLLQAADAEDVRAVTDADPVVTAGLGLRYECSPMLQAVLHPRLAAPAPDHTT